MFKTVIKFAVVVLLIKELWLLLQIPSVADAVFSFVMVGQVPGTETSLSPNQMIWFLVGVFVLLSSLIFRKELMGVLRRKKQVLPVSAEQAVVAPKPAKMPIAHPSKTARPSIVSSLSGFANTLATAVRSKVGRLADLLRRKTYASYVLVRPKMQRGAALAWTFLYKVGQYAWKLALVVYILVSAAVILSWQWLRPRIERFDRWLDKKLHQNEYTAAVLAVGKDMRRTLAKGWEDFKRIEEPARKDARE